MIIQSTNTWNAGNLSILTDDDDDEEEEAERGGRGGSRDEEEIMDGDTVEPDDGFPLVELVGIINKYEGIRRMTPRKV